MGLPETFNEMYSNPTILIGFELISIIFAIALFLLKGYAIYTMAKRRNFDKLWMAYVPFVNYVLLGKIVGKVIIWGKEVKNIGLLVCIATAVALVISELLNAGYYVYLIEKAFSVEFRFASDFIKLWVAQTGLVFDIVYYVWWAIDLIKVILSAWLIILVFRKYAPQRAMIYTILAIFFDFTFPILLFMVRNNKVVTFEDFLRQRNSFYGQNPNQYGGYGNPYNNPYNTPYNNPYNSNNNNNQGGQEVDPFPEFSNNNSGSNNSTTSENNSFKKEPTNNQEDDLFN